MSKIVFKLKRDVTLPEIKTALREEQTKLDKSLAIIGGASPDTYAPAPVAEEVRLVAKAAPAVSQLVDETFPFDNSQLRAINGIINQQFACLTGAAGTGKTTVTKAVIDGLLQDVGSVELSSYFKTLANVAEEDSRSDQDDDYVIPKSELYVPAICAVSYTGRSSQEIKRNFPDEWHKNIMTIHRMLAYVPEWYDDYDPATDKSKKKMRFVPTYTANNKMPWDIILIDEAGMLAIDLWENIRVAMKPSCRVIMVGDINQLPPVHGRSIFGFALNNWPSFELTTIHRQEGANNSIVDNAWRVLQGQPPVSDGPRLLLDKPENMVKSLTHIISDKDWKFLTVTVPEEEHRAFGNITKSMELLYKQGFYKPETDVIITAINGKPGSAGQTLGQVPLNDQLSIGINKTATRYVIDAGRERRQFGVGDKVMATVNDHEISITNGMCGFIVSIERNGEYTGDWNFFDEVEASRAYIKDGYHGEEVDDFDLSFVDDIDVTKEREKEDRFKGPSSHIVVVNFGSIGGKEKLVTFSTKAELASLIHGYAVTCHKMQGGQAPTIFIICHSLHSAMYYREWLYTAVTRAQHRVVLISTAMGIKNCLVKQKIKGNDLKAKSRQFALWQKVREDIRLPTAGVFGDGNRVYREVSSDVVVQDAPQPTETSASNAQAQVDEPANAEAPTIQVTINVTKRYVFGSTAPKAPVEQVVEGEFHEVVETPALPAPTKLRSTYGAYKVMCDIEDLLATKMLPAPAPEPKPVTATKKMVFNFKLRKGN